MSNKILYILGAGASMNALPLIKETLTSKGLPLELVNYIKRNGSVILSQTGSFKDQDIETLKSIAQRCALFGTPDLCAKYFKETGDTKSYILLKKMLSFYFREQEHFLRKKDIRALTFLTTIAQGKKISDRIKIISWNYDTQMERAAEELKPINNYSNCLNGFNAWPNALPESKNDSIFLQHINGVAGYCYNKRNFREEFKSLHDYDCAEELLLSFAWEEDDEVGDMFHKNRISVAENLAEGVEIVVIIGYSFPFFNRKYDSLIFDKIKASARKIYLQDPLMEANSLKVKFGLNELIDIEVVRDVSNYFVPFEL